MTREAASGDPLAALPPLRQVIARHGLTARQSLGQHFLLDLNLTARIARAAAPLDGHTVFEVGPGPGGLTRALLAQGATEVVAVEKDPRCLEALAELARAAGGRLRLVEGDALDLDLAAMAAGAGRPAKIVANLPYNVATPLLVRWIGQADAFARLTLMFQKEVADRLAAAPRTKAYGRLSVLAQWRCLVAPQFNLPARAFTPPPKVASTVVNLDPRPAPLVDVPITALEKVTAAAFGQRRKMLRQSLRSLGTDIEALLTGTGIAPTARAEELGVEEFCALARRLAGR